MPEVPEDSILAHSRLWMKSMKQIAVAGCIEGRGGIKSTEINLFLSHPLAQWQ